LKRKLNLSKSRNADMGITCTVQMVQGSLFYRLSPETINTNRASSKKKTQTPVLPEAAETRLDEAIKG
jgi:hypothetical protein